MLHFRHLCALQLSPLFLPSNLSYHFGFTSLLFSLPFSSLSSSSVLFLHLTPPRHPSSWQFLARLFSNSTPHDFLLAHFFLSVPLMFLCLLLLSFQPFHLFSPLPIFSPLSFNIESNWHDCYHNLDKQPRALVWYK